MSAAAPSPRTQETYCRWTRAELDALSEVWPKGGWREARKVLPGRSYDSVRDKARSLGLHVSRKAPPGIQPDPEWVDAAICRDYRDGRPHLRALERATGRSTGWLKRRAAILGVASGAKLRNASWTPEEDAAITGALERGQSATAIYRQLQRAGYARSLSAIASRVGYLGLSWSRGWWTATDVARLFGIHQSVVIRWISQGLLAANRRAGPSHISADSSVTYWKIGQEAVVTFMLSHTEQWDHRKMRKEVLLDLLAPERFNRAAAA